MNQARVILVAAFVFATPVIAQSENPYNGKWTVSFDGKNSADLDGSVVIKEYGGTWDIVAQSRKNPCVGRPPNSTVPTPLPVRRRVRPMSEPRQGRRRARWTGTPTGRILSVHTGSIRRRERP